ncbi:MAG: peptidoglycan-binding protein [Bacteroidetes bacterium]|jgi:hypothetical protein|nr:peptidoglycan-binding protein [Bacteroidota bacterium]
MNSFRSNIITAFSLLSLTVAAQNTTINPKEKTEREVAAAHKVMIIPFEQRLYLSEIDYKINEETKMSGKDIKYKFRDGLNEQLYKSFKSAKYNAVDLMEDTAKYRKEMESIYQHLTYDYQKVPDQNNYQPPKKEKETKKIEKGQLNVETNTEARFMNAKITSPKLVPLLFGKHKTDIFVFINELEIKASGSKGPAELGDGNGNRKIIVHYTVYTYDAREINSGIAEEEFSADLNNPKKIIDKHFAKVANLIVQRVNKGLGINK